MTDFEKMNEEELRLANKEITARLKKLDEEKKEKARKKREYALRSPEQKYKTNYVMIWNAIKAHVSKGGSINADNIETFFQKGQEPIRIEEEEIYPCPECGNMSLYVGEYGDPPFTTKKKITCSCCDFDYDAKYTSSYYDVWLLFHNWLVKEGYLPKKMKKEC